ncbi:MAG: NAD(P)/FAD-dependent oxidoreductase [Clostridia bacterium]|nr:NAD(P)/FAD-dependent oxidoreductase [Clostridia bacterium]
MSVIVIGGGPAGMMAAIAAAERGKSVILIEKNERLGRKMYISGKGRCNLTNQTDIKNFLEQVVSNPKFLMSAIHRFSPAATVDFFESKGLSLKTERGGRVFPVSDKSADVIDLMVGLLKSNGVAIKTSETVKCFHYSQDKIRMVITDKGDYQADSVIIATGGVSYPKTGSTGDGYTLAKSLGHTVIEPKPALCPILLQGCYDTSGRLIDRLQQPFPEGLSLKNVEAKITVHDTVLHKEFGEMLFTDRGVSGPIVLSLSSKMNRMNFSNLVFAIDLKPALDEKTLDARILRDFEKANNKQFKNSLADLLPKSLIPYIMKLSCIDPEKPVHSINRAERKALVEILKNMKFPVKALADIEEAIVTAGGVSVKEINPATMGSKIIHNLYFAGEVLDVDALTGGYNIQIALSTGFLAGNKAE